MSCTCFTSEMDTLLFVERELLCCGLVEKLVEIMKDLLCVACAAADEKISLGAFLVVEQTIGSGCSATTKNY